METLYTRMNERYVYLLPSLLKIWNEESLDIWREEDGTAWTDYGQINLQESLNIYILYCSNTLLLH